MLDDFKFVYFIAYLRIPNGCMMHSLEMVTQTACSLILSILLSKSVSYNLRTQLISLLCHLCVVSMTVGGQ